MALFSLTVEIDSASLSRYAEAFQLMDTEGKMTKVLLFLGLMLLAACEASQVANETATTEASSVLDEAEYYGEFNFGENRNVSVDARLQALSGNRRNEQFLLVIHSTDANDPRFLQGQFSNGVMVSSESCQPVARDRPVCQALSDLGDPRYQQMSEAIIRFAYERIAPGIREVFDRRQQQTVPQPSRGPTTVATLFF